LVISVLGERSTMRMFSKSLTLFSIFLILSLSIPNVAAQKIYSLDNGEIETEALEVGETVEVEVEVISGDSIDLYLVPDVEFLKDMTLSGNFSYEEKYSATNVTHFNFTFTPEDDEVQYYVVMVNPNNAVMENPDINQTDEIEETDEAEVSVEEPIVREPDTKVAISVIYPEIEQRALVFGIIATAFVIFLYSYIFLVIRSKKKNELF